MDMRESSVVIRQFILEHVEKHPGDIVALTAQAFGISRQAAHRHLQRLVRAQELEMHGTTRSRRYTLATLAQWMQAYPLSPTLQEDRLWREDIRPLLEDLPENVRAIWNYGVTEMINNAIEHSAGKKLIVSVKHTALDTTMQILDDGEGIFKKLQRELGLEDERHAVLELAKGKVTTDPAHHTGEGIFFASRMFDTFFIWSGNVVFSHQHESAEDWIGERKKPRQGTSVMMDLKHTTSRTPQEVFDQFSAAGEYSFTQTVVPVHLAQYGDEQLISRSQGKRLVAGLDRFKRVLYDFAGVGMIGQAFADEVFRVFAEAYPHIELVTFNVCPPVAHMIRHVAGDRAEAILGLD